ncbi:hypothetical protein Tco_1487045, partial [Tanacetum coccineum]
MGTGLGIENDSPMEMGMGIRLKNGDGD